MMRAFERYARPIVLSVLGFIGLFVGPGGAQVSPHGPEFQVNSFTTNHQRFQAIAMASEGNFVVAWQSYGSSGSDTSYGSIQAQIYDASGAPLGDQFQVNSSTAFNQLNPAVALIGQSHFVVVWQSQGPTRPDSNGSIQAQLFDANGAPVGGEFQVNSYTTDYQEVPAVAADSQGDFVVVWASYGSFGTDTRAYSVQGQRFDASGAPLGSQFQINTYTTDDQLRPTVAVDGQGRFVVAWVSRGSNGSDTGWESIQAQRYDANGLPVGSEFQVNSYTPFEQWHPAVTADVQGNFVVAWQSRGSSGTDTSDYSIQAQRYDANGDPLGSEFQVNSYTTDYQLRPAVVTDAQGNFVVAWESFGSGDTDSSSFSVQAQRFDASGARLGSQFQVNTYTTGFQGDAVVAEDAQGRFAIAWVSRGSSGTDTSGYSIQAQRYDTAFFYDGFESADSSRWSLTVP